MRAVFLAVMVHRQYPDALALISGRRVGLVATMDPGKVHQAVGVVGRYSAPRALDVSASRWV
jgi:hypothetical protein